MNGTTTIAISDEQLTRIIASDQGVMSRLTKHLEDPSFQDKLADKIAQRILGRRKENGRPLIDRLREQSLTEARKLVTEKLNKRAEALIETMNGSLEAMIRTSVRTSAESEARRWMEHGLKNQVSEEVNCLRATLTQRVSEAIHQALRLG
jgi:hypothetical protein